ncbi:MAG: MFS transporter [Chloroflexota bacterium]|nr:MFS transporter [Chloroflexota bacterium]
MEAAIPRLRNPLDPRNPLAGVYVATMMFELAEGALRFLVPLNLDARGLSPAAIGIVFFVFSFTSLLSRGVAGALFRPDRARRLIVGAGLASTFAYLITPFVTDVSVFAILMAFDGFGWGIATTCLLAMVMLCTPTSISPAVAMGWFIGFQGIAFAIATTVGGILGQVVGIQTAMLMLATLPVVAAIVIAFRLPPVVRATDVPAIASGVLPSGSVGRRGALVASIRRLGVLPYAVWAAALVAVYLNVMNGLLASFFPLLGLAIGLSVVQIGTLSSVRSGISSVARFGAGWLFARVPASRMHLPLLTTSAVTLALLPSAGSYIVCLPLFALNGVSRGLLRVTTSAAAMEETPGHRTGVAAAVMTSGLDIGKMVGPLIGGLVASAIGLEAMFRTVPLAFLILFGALVLVGNRRGAGRRTAVADLAATGDPGSGRR